MRFFDHIRFLLIAIVAVLGLVCALLPWVVHAMEDIVERTTRHDVAWNGADGRDDCYNMRRKLLAEKVETSANSWANARLAHEILTSRLNTWRLGAFGSFVAADPKRQRWLAALDGAVGQIGELLNQPPTPEQADRMLTLINGIEPAVQMLSRAACVKSTHDLAETARKIQLMQKIQEGLIALLIVGSFVLVCLLLRQNSALRTSVASESRTSVRNAFMAAHDALSGLANRSTAHLDKLCDGDSGGGVMPFSSSTLTASSRSITCSGTARATCC
jgi:hypothetical protein